MLKVLAGQEGITRLMVEGGPKVAGGFAAANLVDEISWRCCATESEYRRSTATIEALEGMPIDGLTGQLQSRGREKLGADTLEMFERA